MPWHDAQDQQRNGELEASVKGGGKKKTERWPIKGLSEGLQWLLGWIHVCWISIYKMIIIHVCWIFIHSYKLSG